MYGVETGLGVLHVLVLTWDLHLTLEIIVT